MIKSRKGINILRPNVVLILVVLLLGTTLHLIGIGQPFLGNFAQHQTDYATVVQKWLKTGIDPLHPAMRFLAHGRPRLFLGDIPFTMTIVAIICKITGLGIEVSGRGFSAFLFFLSLIPFYFILRRIFPDKEVVGWVIFFYVFSPLTVIYGQAFLLEIPALTAGLFAYSLFLKGYWDSSKRYFIFSGLFFAVMISLRIYYALLLMPPLLLMLLRCPPRISKIRDSLLLIFISSSLPIAWHVYAYYKGMALDVESSLLDNLRVFVLDDPTRSKMAYGIDYYKPVFYIMMNKLLTPVGIVFVIISVFMMQRGRRNIIAFLWFSIFAFSLGFWIAPRKFIEFEYYYLPLVPFLAVLAGLSIFNLLRRFHFKRMIGASVIFFNILLSIRFSISPLLIIPAEDRYVLEASSEVKEIVPEASRVIASHGSSTSFLYYTERDGWAFQISSGKKRAVRFKDELESNSINQLELYKSQGAEYFAVSDRHQLNREPMLKRYLEDNYERVDDSPRAIVYSLSTRV
ncbi:MAG: glycosyltransferase family 39 protein [Candidatus Omnitrophica bacterium]|nr:glycosyltransferase family 39 protein [Candidatus Omnitrophota bacterium]